MLPGVDMRLPGVDMRLPGVDMRLLSIYRYKITFLSFFKLLLNNNGHL